MSENTRTSIIVCCLIICVAFVMSYGCQKSTELSLEIEKTKQEAFKNGLIEKLGEGTSQKVFVKP